MAETGLARREEQQLATIDATAATQVIPRGMAGILQARAEAYPRPEEWRHMLGMAAELAKAGIGPKDVASNPAKMVAVALKGWELGLGMMEALDGIHVVEGKTQLSARLLHALAQSRIPGAVIEWEEDGRSGIARCRARRPGRPDVVSEYTWDEACQAGLTTSYGNKDKANWSRSGPSMLRAFVLRHACRQQYPEIEFGFDVADDPEPQQSPPAAEPPKPAPTKAKPLPAPKKPAPELEAPRPEPVAVAAPAPKPEAPPAREPSRNPGEFDDFAKPTTPRQASPVVEGPLPIPGDSEGAPEGGIPFRRGPLAGRDLATMTHDELSRVIAGYENAIAKEPGAEANEQRKEWLARAVEWLAFRTASSSEAEYGGEDHE